MQCSVILHIFHTKMFNKTILKREISNEYIKEKVTVTDTQDFQNSVLDQFHLEVKKKSKYFKSWKLIEIYY